MHDAFYLYGSMFSRQVKKNLLFFEKKCYSIPKIPVQKVGIKGMISKKNLNQKVYEEIKNDILQKRIGFGEKLINRALQEKYGVSSTPVRDAINRLYLDGLLEDISNVGARVITFDHQMALEVNEVMALLSCEAISMAAERGDREKIVAQLEKNLQAQIKNANNEEKYYKYDRDFHNVFPNFCGNYKIRQIFESNSALWELLVHVYPLNRDVSHKKFLSEHEQILSAFKNNDIEAARHCMKRHFDEPLINMLNEKALSIK